MNQRSKVINIVLLCVWCFLLLTTISQAKITPDELHKIEDAMPAKATLGQLFLWPEVTDNHILSSSGVLPKYPASLARSSVLARIESSKTLVSSGACEGFATLSHST